MLEIITDVYKSLEVLGEEGNITVKESDKIEFTTSLGEIKTGTITKLSGKGDKTKITIVPEEAEHIEVWSVEAIAEGTLKLV